MSNLPVIPVVPNDESPSLKKFLSSIKELVETREGRRGIHADRFVTFADLGTYEFAASIPDGTYVEPGDLAELDGSVPDPPTNLVVAKGNWYNHLTWTVPTSDIVSHTEIWCSTSQDRSLATRIAIVTYPQAEYDHRVPIVTDNHYYWIRSISFAGLYSTWEPSSALGGELVEGDATVGETIDRTLDILLGTTPDLYNALLVYHKGDLVRYVDTDGTTRRYRYINDTPSGNLPTNTTYWERIGILVQGDVDGIPTVGIDGNLVVDDTILARNIAADQINGTHIHAESEITLQDNGKLTIGNNGDIIIGNGGAITVGGVISIDGGSSSAAITVSSGGDIVINNGGGLEINYGGDITLAARTYAEGNPGFIKWNVGATYPFQMGGFSNNNSLTLGIPNATTSTPIGRFLIGRDAALNPTPLSLFQVVANQSDIYTNYGSGTYTRLSLTNSSISITAYDGTSTASLSVSPTGISISGNTDKLVIPGSDDTHYLGSASYRWKEVRGVDVYATTLHTTDLISTTGNLRPGSSGSGAVGGSGYHWGSGYFDNLYYHTQTVYDKLNDLEVIADLATKVETKSSDKSDPIPDLTLYPDFLTNKDAIKKQIKEENGGLISDEDLEKALKDKKDLGGWLLLNASNHSALLEGAIRQQYELYKQLESRVTQLEGG